MHTRPQCCSLFVALTTALVAIASIVHAAPPVAIAQAEPFPSSLEPLPPPTASAPPAATTPAPRTTASAPSTQPMGTALPPPVLPPAKRDSAPATLFDSNMDFAFGGFGGVAVMYTRVANKDGVQICGEGAIIIDHALTFGGGGCGFATPVSGTPYTNGVHDKLHFGYGGAIIRYHLFSKRLVNVSVGTLIGAGGIVIGNQLDAAGNPSDKESDWKEVSTEAMFVIEPQVGAYLNFTRWARAAVLGGYRLVSGVETKNLSASDLSGVTLGGALQFGWF